MPPTRAQLLDIVVQVSSQLGLRAEDFLATSVPNPQVSVGRTEGFYSTVARRDRLLGQIWLDRYSGHPEPRVWYGVAPADRQTMRECLALCRKFGLGERVLPIRPRDAVGGHGSELFRRLRKPLSDNDFDRITEDINLRQGEFYLGVFDPRDPSVPGVRAEVSRDAAAFIGRFFTSTPEKSSLPVPDKRVERLAVACVRKKLRARGYSVTSRERELCGYDLLARRTDSELHVEVKGTSLSYKSCYLTANEWNTGRSDAAWRLFLVTNVLEDPSLHEYSSAQLAKAFTFTPRLWRLEPKSR